MNPDNFACGIKGAQSMEKPKKRIICICLLFCLAVSIFASCGIQPDAGRETSPENETLKETETAMNNPKETETHSLTDPETNETETAGTATPVEVEKPDRLKINLLSEAWNVPARDLSFYWSDPVFGQDAQQKSYRLVIGTGSEALQQERYVYDSGWVESSECTGVQPAGLVGCLDDGRAYVWSVCVRYGDGDESGWAEPMPFVTARTRTQFPAVWTSAPIPEGVSEESGDLGDLTLEATFSVTEVALGILFRSPDPDHFYMWQFKVSDQEAQLNPHVYMDGQYVGNAPIAKLTVPDSVSFRSGDTVHVRIETKGDTVTTSLMDADGRYVEIDRRDMSDYGLKSGRFGFRTGGKESGTVSSLLVYHTMEAGGPSGVVYRSDFSDGVSCFPGCTVSGGTLQVPKSLSKGSIFNGTIYDSSVLYPDADGTRRLTAASDEFAFFRSRFSLDEETLDGLSGAVLEITASSPEPARQYVYTVYCNGSCLGVGPTRTGLDGSGATVLRLDAYDVLPLLETGENVISVLCYAPSGKQFFAALTLYDGLGDGTEILSTAQPTAWLTLAANPVFRPSQSLGTSYYRAYAENLDATFYPFGFDQTDFTQDGWHAAVPVAGLETDYTVLPATVSPVRRLNRTSEDVTVTKVGEDYVIDLGQEIVGSFGLSLSVPAACDVELYFGERLNPDGTVRYQMNTGNVYRENWRLRQGAQDLENYDLLCYRYVQISGCPVPITPDMVRPVEIRCDFEDEASSLSSDSVLLEELWDLTKATAKYTTQSLYVDSQTRERAPYEGDAVINQLVCAAFSDDYTVARATIEYLLTHRTWPAEYVLLMPVAAYDYYLRTGDISGIRSMYPLLAGCQFGDRFDPAYNLIRMEVKPSSSTDSILVDWPAGERFGYDMNVEYNTAFNALAVASYRALSELADACGRAEDAAVFSTLADSLTAGLAEHLYDASQGVFYDGLKADGTRSEHAAQQATSFALYAGAYVSAFMRDKMAASIARTGAIRGSVYGAFFLLEGLYRSGHGDVANRLLLSEDPEDTHTWAYMLSRLDATLSAEAWSDTAKTNLSLSHPWGATPAVSIVNGIFGIRPTSPGFASAEIRLQPGELTSGSLRTPTLRGEISVSYRFEDGVWNVDVTVPSNMEAVLLLPWDARDTLVTLNGKGAGFELRDDGFVRVDLCCGAQSVRVGTSGPTDQ